MKTVSLLAIILFLSTGRATAQEYNRWSIDANFGFSNAMGPFAEGYLSNALTFFHAYGGARYMFTNKFGVGWDFCFDRIKDDEVGYNGFLSDYGGHSLPFETHLFALNMQLYFDLGRMIEIEEIHEDFSALLHLGIGFSSLKDKKNSVWFKNWKYQGTDEMLNVRFGLKPQYRINDQWSLNLDFMFVFNAFQSKTFDFTEDRFNKGLGASLFDISFGACYYLGDRGKHLDWVIDSHGGGDFFDADTIKTIETIRTIETIKVRRQQPDEKSEKKDATDDDKNGGNNGGGESDGAEKSDHENKKDDTEAKMQPNADFDGDGILNKDDHCPTTFGDLPTGCSSADRDGDGVRNELDECPDLSGVEENKGCPPIDLKVKMILNDAMIKTEFGKNNATIEEESYPYLDKVVQVLNDHPEYDMQIFGHTDNLGEDGPLLSLSKARANKVVEYLVSKGIEASRLSAEGFGKGKPIAPNDSPSGRAQNERIEFKIRFR